MDTLFGRNPAMLASLINAAIVLFGGHVLHLDGTKQGALAAVSSILVSLAVAWKAHKDGIAAVLYGLAGAIISLVIAFGQDIDGATQADIMMLVGIALGYFTRQSITAPVNADGERVLA